MTAPAPYALAGVIGWPVAHSRSPRIHGHWIAEHRVSGAYVLLAVPPGRLPAALRGLPALGFAGCNVTVPHKVEAMRLVDRVDTIARRIGAVNTIVVEPDGALAGTNTDAYGFIESLRESDPGWRADAGPAVILGAGGAARAVVAALIDAGAPEIRVVNRSPARAEALVADLGGPVRAIAWSARHDALDGAALLVQTTNQGMHGEPPLDIALDALPVSAVVCDVVYVPLETPLLAAARRRGHRTVDGLGMLLHQARAGFAAWYGVSPRVTPALRAAILATL